MIFIGGLGQAGQDAQCHVEGWEYLVLNKYQYQCNYQGTKSRTRICSPASNGGAQCPDKREHKDLYYETKHCTRKDCESLREIQFILLINLLKLLAFFEGQWGDWSSCSKTCGEVCLHFSNN